VVLLVDGVMKVMKAPVAVEGTVRLGYPESVVVGIGVLLLVCTLLCVPRTSILGAMLLTGYLGGAVAPQVRVGDPLFSAITGCVASFQPTARMKRCRASAP
jgi:hypothetical protein